MSLLTEGQRTKLIANFRANQQGLETLDPCPVVKIITPDANATWLLTEFDPCTELFFGLCDLGFGFPELGYVALADLETCRGALGLPVERDRWFKVTKPLSAYANEAARTGRIIA
ncbi:single-stranded DNA endonuclease [Jannaschia pagri]|uniref:Single-stranded DNA endonuclease n=1 Tax=Jannaschia pagri TaxID=2829797 RepID=A0ABQ4NRY7_9RHOB|nr:MULTISPECIES: DUF2958 domain-containing protein [unclassified Jannaschia]GIT93342.1 single-stranded DNA endonuclease [Jannaschia sp. AI_61]GIT97128.1 single-stranded DNA endonuclease [Jannaschia sp. AI_62]